MLPRPAIVCQALRRWNAFDVVGIMFFPFLFLWFWPCVHTHTHCNQKHVRNSTSQRWLSSQPTRCIRHLRAYWTVTMVKYSRETFVCFLSLPLSRSLPLPFVAVFIWRFFRSHYKCHCLRTNSIRFLSINLPRWRYAYILNGGGDGAKEAAKKIDTRTYCHVVELVKNSHCVRAHPTTYYFIFLFFSARCSALKCLRVWLRW